MDVGFYKDYEYYYVGTRNDEVKENASYDCFEFNTWIWWWFTSARTAFQKTVDAITQNYPWVAKYQDDLDHGGARWSMNIQINKTLGEIASSEIKWNCK